MNWLDIVLLVLLAVTFILGIRKGLIRQVVGIAAVIIGLIVAVYNYSYIADFYMDLVSNRVVSQLLGFFTVFIAVLLVGWLVAALLSKIMIGPLKFLNHILGGILGLLKGILIAGVIVFALLVFPVDKRALRQSELAPYCFKITEAIYYLIPESLKQDFKEAYRDITGKGKKYEKI